MFRATNLLFLFMLLVAAGCSSSNDVVSKGPFQKRKYRPGWHSSGSWGAKDQRARKAAEKSISSAPQSASVETTDPGPEDPTIEAMGPLASVDEVQDLLGPGNTHLEEAVRIIGPVRPSSAALEEDRTARPLPDDGKEGSITEPRHWNRMAILSGVFLFLSALVFAISGGTPVMVFLLTFSFITGIIGLILTTKHDERGKGISIAAIAFPLVLIGLALIAMNNDW